MLALIAGTGGLPFALVTSLAQRGEPAPLICEMRGFQADVPADLPRLPFRMETLGSFLADLRARGVTRLCLAGAVARPQIDPAAIDAATAPLVPRLMAAMAQGDDGALRAFIAIFEETGLRLCAAHDIAPDLLPPAGAMTRGVPTDSQLAVLPLAHAALAEMASRDIGQSCILAAGQVIATERQDGTDAMISARQWPVGAFLYKAPKPGQDRRADLPVIGPDTARNAIQHGLSGIVIAQGGVMVLDRAAICEELDAAGGFLWVEAQP